MEVKDAAEKLAQEYGISTNGHKPVFNVVSAAGKMLEHFQFAKLGGTLYIYVNGCYQPTGEEIVREYLTAELGNAWKPERSSGVVTWLHDSAPPLKTYPDNVHLINVINGLVNIDTGEHIPLHDPRLLQTVQIPVEYDPDADCPKIKQFISEVFPPDVQALAYEMAGYLLVPDNTFQKAFLLTGEGANGKSTYLNLLTRFLGPDNVAHKSLHDLANSRFATADLFGKLANICPDLDAARLESVSTFKAIVGGDPIEAERKHRDPFKFQPFCRLLFSANEVPGSPDSSFAYRRRWIVVPFPNKFEGNAVKKDILSELTNPRELSGLFNIAIAAYKRLKERRSFSSGESTQKGMEQFIDAIDPVPAFIRECLLVKSEAKAYKADVFKAFQEWSETQGRKPSSAQRFNQRLMSHLTFLPRRVKELPTRDGRPYWPGIGLLNGDEDGQGELFD